MSSSTNDQDSTPLVRDPDPSNDELPITTTTSTTSDVVVADDDDQSSLGHQSGDAHLNDSEVARVRTMLNDGSFDDDVSRVKWFLLGFLAALIALVIAAGVFLAITDEDDDGEVDVQVPTVDLDVDG